MCDDTCMYVLVLYFARQGWVKQRGRVLEFGDLETAETRGQLCFELWIILLAPASDPTTLHGMQQAYYRTWSQCCLFFLNKG